MEKGKNAYDLHDLGNRHSNHAIEFLTQHLRNKDRSFNPFFLYYPSNSNHGPYTVANEVGGKKVRGAGKMVSGSPASTRLDYIYENDVALGRLINYLEQTKDPRRPSKKLIENTIIIFTSDNGAEVKTKTATGPVRSNKGSCYEGGHRVPFLVACLRREASKNIFHWPFIIFPPTFGLSNRMAQAAPSLDSLWSL